MENTKIKTNSKYIYKKIKLISNFSHFHLVETEVLK